MKRRGAIHLALGLAVAASALSCTKPSVSEYEPPTGLIRGTVLYPAGTARGNVIVLLFAAADPPPPVGTGSPVNFVVVPRKTMFGDAPEGAAMDFSAPFTIPIVPSGNYTIVAFIDADGDFNPLFDVLNQPTAGDVAGAAVDLLTHRAETISVTAGQITAHSVVVSLGQVIPVERPVFTIGSTTTFQLPLRAPVSLTLLAHAIERPQFMMDPGRTRFLIAFADEDGDGKTDDANGDHLPDIYPKVILRRQPTPDDQRAIVIPAVANPLPFVEPLALARTTTTEVLEVIVPPLAVELKPTGERVILSAIPPGRYDTILISGTGQTWQVPNDLDQKLPSGTLDPSQTVSLSFIAGTAEMPGGAIGGTVVSMSDKVGDAFVFAFLASDPPPPEGTGRPVGFARVPKASFAMKQAPFSISGLAAGSYLLRGLLDVDGSFSPLIDLLAQPDAGDVVGGAMAPVVVPPNGSAPSTTVVLSTVLPFDRPAFAITAPSGPIPRSPAPARISIAAHPIAALSMTAASTQFPITLDPSGDQNGDGLPDLLPKVILTKLPDSGDPRVAPDLAPPLVIPALIDPLPFLTALGNGMPVIATDHLDLILPPLAIQLDAAGGRRPVSPIPAGRWRVNVLSPFGQTWSVPNALDIELGRTGATADPSQGQPITYAANDVPLGAIAGGIEILGAPPQGDFQVVVLAFDKNRPPPPRGAGRPLATALIPKAAFNGGSRALYALGGLDSGVYWVLAFLDANHDFAPWFEILNQPDAGDLPGGHLTMSGAPIDVSVNALGGPITGVDVAIAPAPAYADDRPVFAFHVGPPVLHRMMGPLAVRFDAQRSSSTILRADARFPVEWVDLNGDHMADDVTGDGQLDVFPLAVAELLDPNDPSGRTLASPRVLIFGIVDPAQFAALGFPSGDPTMTAASVEATQLNAVFPPVAVDPATRQTLAPPLGRYRVTLIDQSGQTWSVPNELGYAVGDPLADTQAAVLSVQE